jgi:hypothetical protein
MESIERPIQGDTPTHAELWQLAFRQGFEQAESILQIKPDPSLPYCAAVHSTLGMEQIHVGAFKVVLRDGKPTLTLDVFMESEVPLLATCPPSLIDTVPPIDSDPESFSAKWRKKCRNFEVIARLSAGDSTKREVLRDLTDSGRIVFSHIR